MRFYCDNCDNFYEFESSMFNVNFFRGSVHYEYVCEPLSLELSCPNCGVYIAFKFDEINKDRQQPQL